MSPTNDDLRARSMFGFWLGVVTGFALLLLGLPLMGGRDYDSPHAAMAILVMATVSIGAVVTLLQGQASGRRVGIVEFVVGLPIGFVLTGLVFYGLLTVILGAVGS